MCFRPRPHGGERELHYFDRNSRQLHTPQTWDTGEAILETDKLFEYRSTTAYLQGVLQTPGPYRDMEASSFRLQNRQSREIRTKCVERPLCAWE